MKRIYTIEIDLDGAAFEEREATEVLDIPQHLGTKLRDDGCLAEHALFDINGDKVGRARVAKRSK